jgi:hypothetical protein
LSIENLARPSIGKLTVSQYLLSIDNYADKAATVLVWISEGSQIFDLLWIKNHHISKKGGFDQAPIDQS